ncbi:DUF262 domain-containing protein [Desulfotomaculum defluvii]
MAHSSKNISLSEYLEEVHNENILVPQFQRDFVWKKAKMLKLASSLLKGYPIGSFLLMQNSGEYACKSVDGVITESNVNDQHVNSEQIGINLNEKANSLLVLDGQQRSTTAYQIFYGKGKYRFYFNYKKFIDDIKEEQGNTIVSIIEDKIEDWLVCLPKHDAITHPDDQRAKGFFPLDIILHGHNVHDYSQWLDTYSMSNALNENRQLDMDKHAMLIKCKSYFIRQLVESITSYQASEIIIDKNTSPNIVCTIFETINSTGQKLTIFDLLNAKCFPSGFILRNELDVAFENNDIFNDFDKDKDSLIGLSIIKIIGLLCKKSCHKSELLSLKPNEIKSYWNKAVTYSAKALDYIKNNFGVLGLDFFPYKDMLPVIAIIINNKKFIDNENNCKAKLNKWYWHCVFTEYFSNATDSKSSRAIKDILGTDKEKGWFDDDNLIPELINTNQSRNYDYLENLASSQSAQYKAILNLITLNQIQDFSNQRTSILFLKERQLNDHHIYPKKFLKLYGLKGNEANTILNRTLITQESNLKIKDRPPFDYLKSPNIVGDVEFSSQELFRHCILKDLVMDDNFTFEKFNTFKQKRKELIIELIKIHL